MSEYLSKEEIKQWRSSLEKITLEEFAARLGKKVEQKKETNDLIDIVLHGPFSAQNLKLEKDVKPSKTAKKSTAIKSVKKETTKIANKPEKTISKKSEKALTKAKQVFDNTKTADKLRNDVRIVFKKALTDREQKVFDYFAAHKNQIVYAKDLAELLSLPRDYVYKYIKNLRAKIDGETLKNADKGGFVLSV